ncbi:MAG: serine/threonine-protein kinase, partial [Polyangiales bacterium]
VNGGLEGTTLTERITRSVEATGVSFDPERVLRAMRCITEGIAAIHEVGVIHRDIKPDNILLCGFAEDEIAKITDFGVAKAQGLDMTFGPQPVGTIGYAAPEQLGLIQAPTTEATDVFALGVLLYKMLAADDYFRRVPFAQLATRRDDGGTDPRPRLRDAPRLHPEFKNGGAHLDNIDAAIRRATAVRPENRFASAREFRAAIDPSMRAIMRPTTAKGRRSATRERLRTLMMQAAGRTTWTTRHRPGDDRVLRAVAWEPDARCIGVARDELAYWDGKSWFRVPTPEAVPPSALHFALRLAAGHFLLGGAAGVLVELAETGWGPVGPAGDPRLVFEHAAGTTEGTLVIAASLAGAPFLYVCDQGNWRPALQVPHAAAINDIAQLDDTQFVVVGRSQAGGAFVSVYDVQSHQLTPFLASMRPLLAVASDLDGCAYAVGPGGLAVCIRTDPQQGTALALEQVMTERDLSSVAIDPTGVAWAVAQGRVLKRIELESGTPKWETVHSYDWLVPVVGIVAAGGGISACTVDGAVLEGRDERIQVGSLAPPNPTG